MKNLPLFHLTIGALVAVALAVFCAIPAQVSAQNFPEPIPTAEGGQIIHTVLRAGDPNVLLTKKPQDKGERDGKGKKPHPPHNHGKGDKPGHHHGEKGDKPAEVAKKQDCPDCKKAGGTCEKCKNGQVAKKSDCPDCKKAKGTCEKCKQGQVAKQSGCPDCKKAGGVCEKCKKGGPPVADRDGRRGPHPPMRPEDHFKHPLARPADARSGQEKAEQMRKRFEEMRKQRGNSPWFREREEKVPHHLQPHMHTHPHFHPPVAGHEEPHGKHPEIRELQELLERTERELEKTRDSLSMAHKELGDRALMVKKLQDSIKNYQAQLARAEQAGKMKAAGESEAVEKLVLALAEEKKKNIALQRDVAVVKERAQEAVAKIQETAERQVKAEFAKAQKAMAEARAAAEKMREASRARVPEKQSRPLEQKAAPQKPSSDRKKPTDRTPKKPEPNKPSSELPDGIAPIQFKLKSAVDFEARDRVLKEVRALLKESPDAKIKIVGHADDSPYEEVNKDISSNRAGFLASYLRVNGIPAKNISEEGVGNSVRVKGANDNRRVEFEITR